MTALDRPLPIRSAELVLWSLGDYGPHLVRNRRTGETFQLGREEQFLLERLDGRSSADQLRAAFALRFGQALTAEELTEFLGLAARRGLLKPAPEGPNVHPADTICSATFGLRQGLGQSPSETSRPAGAGSKPIAPLRGWAATEITRGGAGDKVNRAQTRSKGSARVSLKRITGWPVQGSINLLDGLGRGLAVASVKLHFFQLKYLTYVPRADDIFIVSYPRSGTTWMQMILYQLTTDGTMEIPHIAEYSPWFERSLCSARGFATRPPPRTFKSHLAYQQIPKGPARYIYIARDGRDVAISCFNLYRNYNGYEGTFEQFFEQFLRGKVQFGSWFKHVRGWWEHRHDPNVLFLTYEDLTRDLKGSIHRIISFCQFDIPSEELPRILERCGFAFMKQYENKFDPAMELLWEQATRLNAFLRVGRVGDGACKLTRDQQARFDQSFHEQMERVGFTWGD